MKSPRFFTGQTLWRLGALAHRSDGWLRFHKVGAVLAGLAVFCLALSRSEADDYALAKNLFLKPPTQYSSAPLWVWNDLLTDEQIVSTLRDLHQQRVRQVFVHPRPGLMTPYLSADWFRRWNTALDEAARLGMNVWIYDENSYPSGFAGGLVPDAMPEARGRGVAIRESSQAPAWSEALLGVYRIDEGRVTNVTEWVRWGEKTAGGRYLTASLVRAGDAPWTAGKCYVDLLYPGVTEKFLDITLESYQRQIGSHFGHGVPGVFTDEPHLRPAGGLPWTEGLPGLFEKRWGYRLLDHLPSLVMEIGDWQKVRHNYYQLLSELFIERWAKPCHDYCARHRLEFTGHYWEHDWPRTIGVPDNMAMYAWHQRPAIDILMNQYQEHTHAQFGNVRAVKELSSVANQLGLRRTLCEAYGAGGWDLRFEDMKRIGDWMYALGVNTLDQHLSYITLRGARKRDHPQSFSYHEPWWGDYHVSGGYFEHLTAAMCQGEQINPVLVIEPTTSAWMHNNEKGDSARLKELGDSFFNLLMALERAQVEYDLGCEEIMARHGSVSNGLLSIGQRRYATVVVPPLMDNVNPATLTLLEKVLQQGGEVLAAGPPPARVDGSLNERGTRLAQSPRWRTADPSAIVADLVKKQAASGFVLTREAGDQGILFHHRRQLKDGELLLLVNTSATAASKGSLECQARGLQEWDLYTGTTRPYAFAVRDQGVKTDFLLPPSGSLLLWFGKQKLAPAPAVQPTTDVVLTPTASSILRREPNLLVLDYVDIVAGGESRTNLYFYKAAQMAFQKNGLPRDPWDNAVQFKNEFLVKQFPADSGFEVRYKFTVEGPVPTALKIVVERPDLYAITFNGQPVTPIRNAWWLDKSFGVIDLAGGVHAGENTVVLKARPFGIYHEIEPTYVLGDFAVKSTESGFVIAAPTSLQLGRWNEQGHPFYSSGVIYRDQFEIKSPRGEYRVHAPAWLGSVARVMVNGKTAGHLISPPYECEVTRWIREEANTVEIEVIGTLKNALGPHHNNPSLGTAWPGMFQNAPEYGPPAGAKYSTVGYGLFEPFVLKQKNP